MKNEVTNAVIRTLNKS